jgi:glycerol-3-phosphate dehydrogenase
VDRLSNREARIFAHRVVKALGPWSRPDLIVPSKGVHLVLPALRTTRGLFGVHSTDGRPFFVLPWLGRTVVGTTETPAEEGPDNLRVEPEEVSYLLDALDKFFPECRVRRQDLLGAYAGIRPLARARRAGRRSLGAISRKHRIVDEGSGILSVVGGRYTTCRLVAQHVGNRIFPGTRSGTDLRPFPGGAGWTRDPRGESFQAEVDRYGLEVLEALFSRYGRRARRVLELADEDPTLGEPLVEGRPELRAEVVHAIRCELAVYPEDFLARRSTLRWTVDNGRSAYDAVEAIFRSEGPTLPPDLDRARQRYFDELEREDALRAG